ncbi:His Kinase A (phospho-acceptor) domain-containing protein [Pseudosulfitobacter pseudonitzschiae]|uniref:histidine kinase n=1 Tax=Pseudosulfitobacter pseudonitzschiae TaxID=1402135 RepID=A0A073IYE9_9RHOB|nr:hypothetical protein SUH3_20615 [Pseudosulfitobacter pseudonitzschiae]SHE89259.1 His Kinase A (phospho-acceptor) domain-containing protein [Pseudosulfitobacter pseudonitzschiae]
MTFGYYDVHYRQMNPTEEISRLINLEYSDKPEWIARLFGITLGSVLLAQLTHKSPVLLWCVGFGLAHLVYYLFLRSNLKSATMRELRIAQTLFLVVLISFVWAPAWMVAQESRAVSLSGAGLFGCVLVYLIRRNDVSLYVIVSEIVVIWGTMTSVLIKVLPEFNGLVSRIGLVICWMALVSYFAQSMLQSRALKLAEQQARDNAAQAQKLAAVGQMAGGIAHDFNNHLTVISGSLELYDDLEDPKGRADCLDAVRTAADQAALIVNELLLFARRTPMRLVNLDANAPLIDIDLLARRLLSREVEMTIGFLQHPTCVQADRRQIVTALLNLIVNANDAMPKGGSVIVRAGLVTISAPLTVAGGQSLPQGRYVSYDVRDTGEGIPAEHLAQVVEPFFTTKPEGKGTGLGLAMVLSIAQSLGGGVLIRSSQRGTTVSVLLPQVECKQVVGSDDADT